MSRDFLSAFDMQKLIAFKMHVFFILLRHVIFLCVNGLLKKLTIIMHSC